MSADEKYQTRNSFFLIFVATFIMGIICLSFGIHFLYEGIIASTVSLSISPAVILLLIIGLLLIVVPLIELSESNTDQSSILSWLTQNWMVLLAVIFGFAILGIIFSLHYNPSHKDKYELLVDLILIMFGLTAAVGYGIFKWIWRNIKVRVDRIAEEDRNVARAEVQSSLGFVLYQQYETEKIRQRELAEVRNKLREIQTSSGIQEEAESDYKKIDYLALTIPHAERALAYANELNETEQEELICRCKNNLAYYLAERYRITRDKERALKDKERALKLARHAYLVAREERALQYVRPYTWEESYAWVLWQYADDDEKSKEKALKIVAGFEERTDIPHPWRKRIKKKWEKITAD